MRDRLSPMVPLSVQLAPQRAAQILCLWVCDNLRMQCSFNLQIKYPFTARITLQGGNKVPSATGCHAEKNPFRPIWLCDTGFHRLCLVCTCIPLRKSCTEFDDPFCRQIHRAAYTALCPSRTETLRILLQYTINARKQQANTVKAKKDFNPESFLCNKSPLIGHKHIQSGPFAYKNKIEKVLSRSYCKRIAGVGVGQRRYTVMQGFAFFTLRVTA